MGVIKDIWIGKPNLPTSIYGSTSVWYGSIVRYTGSAVQGASSYKWYLPYPYDQSTTVTVSPSRWGILSGNNSRYLRVLVGPNDGLVQFMGENKCGRGSAKRVGVSIRSTTTTGGGVPITGGGDGGNIPISTFGETTADTTSNTQVLSVYPNKLNILSPINSPINLILYTLKGKEILRKTISEKNGFLDVSQLPNGTYFVQVFGEVNSIKKIIVNN